MDYVSLNGQLLPYEEARVSVGDAGLLHGAGLFETMLARRGSVFRLARHIERIMRSAKDLGLPFALHAEDVRDLIAELLDANGLADARVRMTATRGDIHGRIPPGSTGVTAVEDAPLDVTLLVTAAPLPAYASDLYEKGIMAIVSPYKQNPENPLNGHKTTSYMDRLLALREAQRAGAGEALWFTPGNETLAEGCISNVFLVGKDGLLTTPPLLVRQIHADAPAVERRLCLPGITRAVLFEAANARGMIVHERGVTIEDVLAAREIFMTNAIIGILPVVRLEGHEVGTGRVGDVTRGMIEGYLAMRNTECP